ncbi:sulfur reduction protein DsrE [Corynebacterium atypicum]|uniref:Sulfur reduction protein DsrE n=1 Tax=Corynebacterium atypicum TaxID=191610 RepID=A0ABN4DBT4_9CORY|nr:DsrE family protein [Corynebacterium atypicum]AIG63753.1 sulfur reduction protein DsrE [Corynebacterium atypicum]
MANTGKYVVSITHGGEDADRASVGFVVANAALGSAQDTMVWLSCEGVRLAEKGVAETVHEEGLTPLKEMLDTFIAGGGKVYACGTCATKRNLGPEDMIDGAEITGAATLVAFTADSTPTVTY